MLYTYIDMNYSIQRFTSDTIPIKILSDLEQFVKNQEIEHNSHPAMKNMGYEPYTGLLFNISNKLRWADNIGSISILYNNLDIIGISCSEISEFDPNFGIGGIRCWLDSSFRTDQLITKHLLNDNLNWCKQKKLHGMILTFNDYNKWIYNAIKRKRDNKAVSLAKVWSNWWNDCIIIDSQIKIRNVDQWCVIKPIIKDLNGECLQQNRTNQE